MKIIAAPVWSARSWLPPEVLRRLVTAHLDYSALSAAPGYRLGRALEDLVVRVADAQIRIRVKSFEGDSKGACENILFRLDELDRHARLRRVGPSTVAERFAGWLAAAEEPDEEWSCLEEEPARDDSSSVTPEAHLTPVDDD